MATDQEPGPRPCFGAVVAEVVPGGIAEQVGIEAGDVIAAIDGRTPRDVLDYQFKTAPGLVRLLIVRPGGEQWEVEVEKDEGDPLGLILAEELFDGPRKCVNRCFFCFVDQLPPGMRRALYLKDDDIRLSVLHGNFVTLTNLTPGDLERLRIQRLSPLRVSIHATDPGLRRKMLGNPSAPPILEQLERLLGWGIDVHGQLVLCPGVNDGPALDRTLGDLLALRPPLSSLAVVPVGVTRHAPPGLRRYGPREAAEVLDRLGPWRERYRDEGGRGLYAADELYLVAGRELPLEPEYGDFPQLENGVGMCRSFISEFRSKFRSELHPAVSRRAPPGRRSVRRVLLLTGALFAPVLRRLAEDLSGSGGPEVAVAACRNELFGPEVTVAGLLSGRDLIRDAAAAGGEWDLVVVPRQAFRAAGDVTLDDLTLDDLRREMGCPVVAAGSSGELAGLVRGEGPARGRRRRPR